MTTKEQDGQRLAELARVAACVRNVDDSLGRTQVIMLAIFMSLPTEQRQAVLGLVEDWGRP